jgi:serine/threonine protein kinase
MLPQTLSHFRVLEEIGAGGMGVVYRAHDEQLDRDVALKVLPAGLLADESARRRFHREALAVAKLNHPNVGAVYEFGGQDGFDFLVMGLVAGVALDTRLATVPLANDELLRLGTQLAEGWKRPRRGIIHRDLKPGNLRLTTDGRLKILDFGLARMQVETDAAPTVTANTATDVSGTLPYMAPEQLRGHAGDERSDVYSAGVVLYEMATGKRPFGEASGAQLITAILEAPPSPPRSRNRHVPPGLESVILKALDKNPAAATSRRGASASIPAWRDGTWTPHRTFGARRAAAWWRSGRAQRSVRSPSRPTSIGGPAPSIGRAARWPCSARNPSEQA